MTSKPKPPAPVLVVQSTFGLTGLRRSGQRQILPGGVVVVSATAGPDKIPADLVPSSLHFHEAPLNGVLQQQWRDEVLEVLIARMA